MLKTLTPLLRCPTCRNLDRELRLEVFAPAEHGGVAEGVLICPGCAAWYPIDHDVLECVPPGLMDRTDLAAFCHRFAAQLAALQIDRRQLENDAASYALQLKQRSHFDQYAREAPGFADYGLSTFIRAAAQSYIQRWQGRLEKTGGWLLDIGCGPARHAGALARNRTLVGFDISRGAIRKATEQARSSGLMATTTFFVGDGDFLPFGDCSFDYVQTLGVLHHLPDPSQAIREIVRVLKPGGIHFAVENNKSAFRGLFDFMMKLRPLWIEEAGPQPMFAGADVDAWVVGLPVQVESWTSIFLPPHFLNALGRFSFPILEWSDRLFSVLPWWRNQGGQLLFTIEKASAGVAPQSS